MIPLSNLFLLFIVFYLIYRFVFNFIVPIFRTTRQVRQQFRNMQDHMQQNGGFQQTTNPFQPQGQPFREEYVRPQEPVKPAPGKTNPKADYLDFEEIK